MSNIVIRTSKYKTKRRNYILLYYIVVEKKLQKLRIFAATALSKKKAVFISSIFRNLCLYFFWLFW